jgi:cell division transport system permease protein
MHKKENEDIFYGVNMKIGKFTMKTASESLKLVAVASLCAFCILVSGHYYRIKNYAKTLSENLNIVVFFDKNSADDAVIRREIEATGLLSVKEYVNAAEAYSKAIEKNPFLKDISVPDAAKSVQSYVLLTPKTILCENFLSEMRSFLERISGIDEIVFDMPAFKHYTEVENLLSFFRKIFFIFAVIVFIFFVFKCIFFVLEQELDTRKIVANIFPYLVSSAAGFLILWSVCVCARYPLLTDKIAIFSIISFIAILGVILD